MRKGFHCCSRLLVAVTGARNIPVGFVVLKDDGVTIDALGVWTRARKLGVAKALVDHCVGKAREKKVEGGEEYYDVNSLISALLFWRKMGFEVVKVKEMNATEVRELEFHRPVRKRL